jgi:hypothetical protein
MTQQHEGAVGPLGNPDRPHFTLSGVGPKDKDKIESLFVKSENRKKNMCLEGGIGHGRNCYSVQEKTLRYFCVIADRYNNVEKSYLSGEPAISLHSHHVSLVQWTTHLLPVTRDPGSNPQGGTDVKPGLS